MTAPTTIPSSAEELADFLHDDTKVADLITNGGMGEFTQNYIKAALGRQSDLEKQFQEQIQKGLRDFLKDNGQDVGKLDMTDVRKARTNGLTNKDKGQRHNPRAMGAALDKEFGDNAFELFQMSWHKRDSLPNARDLSARVEKHYEITNAFGSNAPSDGGFLIPEILRSEILQLALESSIVRPAATVIPMDSLKVPIPTVDETSRVSNVYGGVVFSWVAEGAQLPDTSAKFGQITLDAKKLVGYAGIPNELMRDAPSFNAWFAQKFPAAFAWFEDISYLTGDGTDKPLGVQPGAGVVSVSRTGSNAIVYQDIVNMYMRMYPTSMRNAQWIASFDTVPQLMELSFTPAGGSVPVPVMLWQMNAQGAPVATLLGRPITFTEKVPALGSTGDLMLVDFSEYLIGDRQAMTLDTSEHYLFGTDKTAFRVIGRGDGRPWLQSAITPHNGSSNTLSPYVILHA